MEPDKKDELDSEVIRLLSNIKEAERSIVDNHEFGNMVRRHIKMHEEDELKKKQNAPNIILNTIPKP